MRTLVIEIPEPHDERQACGFDLVDEQGRRCNGLNWDELIGQITSLTHPAIVPPRPQYPMRTRFEWDADRAARQALRQSQGAVVGPTT